MSAIKKSVLIVDDDSGIRETLHSVLEDAGYAVFEVQDGMQALDYLRKTPVPMIVLLDLMMPRLDGAGLLGAVAGDTRRLVRHRYVLMTASHETLSLAFVHLLSDLTVPVVRKPFDMDELLKIIASRKLPSS